MKINILLRTFTLTCVLISLTPCSIAAEAIENKIQNNKIASYLMSADVKKSLHEVSVMWDKLLGINCSGSYEIEIKPENVFISSAISMAETNNHPTEGLWNYKFSVKRCGETKIYNVAFLGNKNTTPKLIALIPGQTAASPQLILDTSNQLRGGIKTFTDAQQGTKCNDFAFTDSKVTIPPAAENPRSQFEEIWSYRYCGNIKPVTICFIPNQETGGMSFRTESCKDIAARGK